MAERELRPFNRRFCTTYGACHDMIQSVRHVSGPVKEEVSNLVDTGHFSAFCETGCVESSESRSISSLIPDCWTFGRRIFRLHCDKVQSTHPSRILPRIAILALELTPNIDEIDNGITMEDTTDLGLSPRWICKT